ncbi:DUF881 domain-containing protein [Aquibacillus sediminis]|uniref:DUF881 domain-containing protein n=1 Tax=Aquibacillus sediminis TaxID=2574734 RepID=UPI001108B00C|nr:DUF881 domain-containing protein [Aquibacillus sediminis]
MKVRGNHVILSFVLVVAGFLIAFNYQHTTKSESHSAENLDQEWEKDYYYRDQLIDMEEENKQLRHELQNNRQEIQQLEVELGNQQEMIGNLVDIKTELQLYAGELPINGSGLAITLKDPDYIPSEENVNQYIVHDRHIHLVINELLSAGAAAIGINGQRVFNDSYIACVGPVIMVDGKQYQAPFTITAIGEQDVLDKSLNLSNGVVDQLLSDNIEVELEHIDTIELGAKMPGER